MKGWVRILVCAILLLTALTGIAGAVNLTGFGGLAWQKCLGGTYTTVPGDNWHDFGGIAWQKYLGGLHDDVVSSIQQTADGGYVVAGYSFSKDGNVTGNHGDADFWVVKITAAGIMDWQKCLGGLGTDEASSVRQTMDGGYIVAGYTTSNDGNVTSNHGGRDYWVVKLDRSGNSIWQRCLGGSADDGALSIQQTADGGYIVAGNTDSYDGDVTGNHGTMDYWVVKLDGAGTLVWQKCLGGSGQEIAYSIQQTADGGYIIAGETASNDGNVAGNHGAFDSWVVKLDSNSNLIWQRCLGGSQNDQATSILQTADGGYILAGSTESNDGNVAGNHGGADYWVVRLYGTGTILSQRCFGGSNEDRATSIQQTADSGYIVSGYSYSNDGEVTGNQGNYDYWIIRLSSSDYLGVIWWVKCLGGTRIDWADCIQQTADGGFIVAGHTTSNDGNVSGNHGDTDYWVVKLNPDTRTGSTFFSGNDRATSIQQTSDGGYIVAGSTNSKDGNVTGNHGGMDYWVVKITATGIVNWQMCLGGSNDDRATSIQQTADGGYIVAGQSYSRDGNVTGNHGSMDYWVVKLDSSGSLLWQKCVGGSRDDAVYCVQQTADGGYILAGTTLSNNGDVNGNHGSMDYWIVKLDGAGNLLWQQCLGGSQDDAANSVQQTADGGYVVAGYSVSNDGNVYGNHGGLDYWIVKLDGAGTLLWQQCLGGSSYDMAYDIQQTADGGYVVAGYSLSNDGNVTGNHGIIDYWIVKLDSAGTILWQKCLGGSQDDVAYSIQQTTDGGYIVAGYTYSIDGNVAGNHGNQDYWIVKLDSTGTLFWQKCLGGINTDIAASIQQTSDGGYIAAGYTASNDGDVSGNHDSQDYWVVKLNTDSRADFSAVPRTVIVNEPVRFTDLSSMPDCISWNWLFGDGQNSDAANPNHTYMTEGSFTVTLTVTDAFNNNASMKKTSYIQVTAPPLQPGIDLATGWNFVATPRTLSPGFNNGSMVFGAVETDGHTIWLYNASSAVWEHVTANTPIKPLDGIWIYSMNPAHVNLTYSTDPVGSLPRKQLYAGWNAIGFAGKNKASAWATLSSISAKWIRVMGYNSTALEFDDPMVNGETYGQYSMYRDMVPTKGYWLYVTSDTPLEAFSA